MAAHRNRLRVRVRSFVTNQVLRYVSETEARTMTAENADGSDKLGQDGKPLEAVAYRLSRIKAPLMDIRLKAPERQESRGATTITRAETENNAFVHEGVRLSAKDSMREFDSAVAKIKAWPFIHDMRNTIISAGIPIGVYCIWPPQQEHFVNFGQ